MEQEGFFAEPRNWVALACILFFVLLGRKLWSALTGMLDKRAESVRAELAEASRLREEAETLLADANARREAALEEAKTLLAGAKNEAARLAAAAAEDARAAATRREHLAIDRIAAAEKAALEEVRLAAVEIATTAATKIIGTDFGADADSPLIDHAIAELPKAMGRRAA